MALPDRTHAVDSADPLHARPGGRRTPVARRPAESAPPRVDAVLRLQRTAGNHAVGRLLQRPRGGPATVIQRQWQWLRGVFARNPGHSLARYEVLDKGFKYRVDTRPPPVVRRDGFFAKVVRMPMDQITQEDIRRYQVSAVYNPGVVSVADTLEGAETFARQLGQATPGKKYIYKIDVSGLIHFPVTANIPWYQRLFYSEQQESMISFGIESDRISLENEVETDGTEPEPTSFLD